jgi:PAS domain S-box-containing protein
VTAILLPSIAVAAVATAGVALAWHVVRARRVEPDPGPEELEPDEAGDHLRLALTQTPAALWTVDRALRVTSTTGAGLGAIGLARDGVVGHRLPDLLEHDAARDEHLAAHQAALRGRPATYDGAWAGGDYQIHVRPLRDESGRIVGGAGIALEITQRKRSEERQRLLMRELDHRVRNNLTSLAALVDLSARSARDTRSLADSIRLRVLAMARMHDLLSQSHWTPVDFRRMLDVVKPIGAVGVVECSGPPLLVPASQGAALAMVMQELMTNSLKYGALGAEGGRARVEWEVEPDERGGTRCILHWRETGGPPVEGAIEPGVGTRLVTGLVRTDLRGSLELTFPREGARHRLEIVLESEPAIAEPMVAELTAAS